MKKLLIAAVAVIALAGVAVAAVPIIERHAAAQIKVELERNAATKVGEVDVGLFSRRIILRDLKTTGLSEVSVGRWEASGLAWPLGELLSGRTPLAGFRWGDPLQADRVELQDVRVVDPAAGSHWSMQWLAIDGLDLARFDAKVEGQYQFHTLTGRAMGALTIRRVEQRNVVYSLAETGHTVAMASAVMERYERGRIASLTMAGFEATLRDGQSALYSVADIKVDGLDLRRLVAAMSSDKWYPGAPVGRLHVDNASASGFGGETFKRYGISLAAVRMDSTRESEARLHSTMRVEGFVLAPPLRGLEGLQTRLALQSMGLKEVKADFFCNFLEERTKGEVILDRCALVGAGLGEIALAGRIVDADKPFWHFVDEGDVKSFRDSQAALGSARLVLADKSLLERGLRALATVTGQPVAATRANLARDIRRYQPPGVLISQSMTQLFDTVARFVEQGGTLTLDAQPQPPIRFEKFEALATPGADLVSILGLSATLAR